jgi:hypothetical protein
MYHSWRRRLTGSSFGSSTVNLKSIVSFCLFNPIRQAPTRDRILSTWTHSIRVLVYACGSWYFAGGLIFPLYNVKHLVALKCSHYINIIYVIEPPLASHGCVKVVCKWCKFDGFQTPTKRLDESTWVLTMDLQCFLSPIHSL